ncbi:hypothetical protein [Couchioplanes caeruleus]|uniref:Uncharacterized protein n=2 Tax=Couchioplanes caeruleus TaxID=56438 RepID=A0A1K0FA89_9ACTN|nr:hypothetical protein [Couchioplanes caeruleus]OJF09789.1 hypothetical protein BG844_35545 [Couchioplanes caeruleus subsp. caeruleus]ROP31435.1 hypothetical protein EDD30_4336 [Couchioplanes caeruleus]
MAKREYGHTRDKNGRVRVVETTLPKHLRGRSAYDSGTYTENQITRAAGAAAGAAGSAGVALVKGLFGRKR